MDIEYTVLDPSGNITVLVETPVSQELIPSVASGLMEYEPEAEQVGFLYSEESCDTALRMAGGEFCGNASMSAAVLSAVDSRADSLTVTLHVSGAGEPVNVYVKRRGIDTWTGTVDMPRPVSVENISLPPLSGTEGTSQDGAAASLRSCGDPESASHMSVFPLVRFRGISHVILGGQPEKSEAESLVRCWCEYLKADALGLIFLDPEAGKLTPLVYVPAAGTLCWENSCASGTAAAGAYLSSLSGRDLKAVYRQPGGSLTIEAAPEGKLLLTGTVRILRHSCISIL